MEELIVRKAKEMFFSYGLKSVSMDDLAKQAGVSKKTIYQFISEKKELIGKVMLVELQKYTDGLIQCSNEAQNAVEEVVLQTKQSDCSWAGVTSHFFYDLERFFPDIWDKILEYRIKKLQPLIVDNIKRGVNENYFRADLDYPFLSEMRMQQMFIFLQPELSRFKVTNYHNLQIQLTEFFLHGITNENGKPLIKKYLNQNQES